MYIPAHRVPKSLMSLLQDVHLSGLTLQVLQLESQGIQKLSLTTALSKSKMLTIDSICFTYPGAQSMQEVESLQVRHLLLHALQLVVVPESR